MWEAMLPLFRQDDTLWLMPKVKRGYGSGTLRKKGEMWYARFYDSSGKQKEVATGETSEKKAQIVLAQKISEASKDSFISGNISPRRQITDFTVSDMLDYYAKQRKESDSFSYSDNLIIERCLKPVIGSIHVKDLTTQNTVEYRNIRKSQHARNGDNAKAATRRSIKKNISHSTIDRELRILKAAIRALWKQGNPLMRYPIHVHLSNEDNKRKGFITQEEFTSKLLPHLPIHIANLISILFVGGMRSSEALRLDRSNVDLDNGFIYIIDSKNKESRDVPIFNGLMREAVVRQLSYCEVMSPDSDALFTWNGKRITVFRRSWETAIEHAGLSDLKPHDLRRSANRNMRSKGIPQGIRMKILGHKTNSQDLRYGIVDKADLETAKMLMSTGSQDKNPGQTS